MSGWEHRTEPSRRAEDRLARLLGPGPRHAGEDGTGGFETDESRDQDGFTDDGFAEDGFADEGFGDQDGWSDLETGPVRVPAVAKAARSRGGGPVRRFWEDRFGGWAFGPPQLAVIVVIVLLGLGLAGWSVLRARPVALAAAAAGAGGTATPQSTVRPADPSTSAGPSPSAGPASASTSSAAPSSAAPVIKVHVLGAVKHPGVVTLAVGARVQDALDRAGGVTRAADLGDLNLAQPIADGQQIFVARDGGKSEVRDPVSVPAGGSQTAASDPTAAGSGSSGSGSAGSGSAGTTSGSGPSTPVNLNTATVDQLDQLPGVGPVTAQKIVDWRTQHGRFDSTEQLQEVDGIGPKTYADLASMVTV